jgi:hypothetical protein
VSPLEVRLAALAASGQTVTYGDLARTLGLSGPGTIRQLTEMLEDLMAADIAAGRPLRAALCTGRLSGGMPGAGFFEAARRLGCHFDDPAAFVAEQRVALAPRP